MTAREQSASCPVSTALAWVQTRLGRNHARLDRFEAMADRERARIEVNRARVEVQAARIRIPAVGFKPIVFSAPKLSECPRVRVSMPRLPRIQVPDIPVIRVETASGGPI